MLTNKRNNFNTLIYFSKFYFLREKSVFFQEKSILLLFIKIGFLKCYIIKFLIQKNKFGLIWSCILKFMNFLAF